MAGVSKTCIHDLCHKHSLDSISVSGVSCLFNNSPRRACDMAALVSTSKSKVVGQRGTWLSESGFALANVFCASPITIAD